MLTPVPAMGLANGRPAPASPPLPRTVADPVVTGTDRSITPPSFNLSDISRSSEGKGGLFVSGGESGMGGAVISIKPWNADAPYLKAMAAVPAEKAYGVFLAQRKDYLASPAFYLDCGNFLLEKGRREEGVRVLTDIVQLRLENAPLLRVAAYRLMQMGEYKLAIDLFEKAKRLRLDEPHRARQIFRERCGNRVRSVSLEMGVVRKGC